jgi:hypothetical protein
MYPFQQAVIQIAWSMKIPRIYAFTGETEYPTEKSGIYTALVYGQRLCNLLNAGSVPIA